MSYRLRPGLLSFAKFEISHFYLRCQLSTSYTAGPDMGLGEAMEVVPGKSRGRFSIGNCMLAADSRLHTIKALIRPLKVLSLNVRKRCVSRPGTGQNVSQIFTSASQECGRQRRFEISWPASCSLEHHNICGLRRSASGLHKEPDQEWLIRKCSLAGAG